MDFSWRSFPLHHRFRFNLYILTVWNDIYVFMLSCVERLFYLLYRIWSYVCWFRSLQCAFYSSKSRSLELTVYITSLGVQSFPYPCVNSGWHVCICYADKLQLSRISSFTLSLQWPSCLSHKIPWKCGEHLLWLYSRQVLPINSILYCVKQDFWKST